MYPTSLPPSLLPPERANSLESVYLQPFSEIQKRTMNQRLNLEQALNCLNDEEDEITQFLQEKKPTKCKYCINLLFFIYSFVRISLLLFYLFSVVHRT